MHGLLSQRKRVNPRSTAVLSGTVRTPNVDFEPRVFKTEVESMDRQNDDQPINVSAGYTAKSCDSDQNVHTRLLERFNATESPYPREKMIHELFEEEVRRRPDSIAVVCADQSITYAALSRMANQLALLLRKRGIGPDKIVALCIERRLEMVVGMLGILKAGGAYLPLDPEYPTARLAYMLNDTAPTVLLTQKKLMDLVPSTPAETVLLEDIVQQVDPEEAGTLDVQAIGATPEHRAYVIYTSGSSGAPKGVMVEHAGVVNFLTSMRNQLGVNSSECMLGVTTISFDIAGLEIYLPLTSGTKLVLANREDSADASILQDLMADHQITIMQATPATWQMLLSAGWEGRSHLKVLCGGEALTADISGKLLPCVGDLWNLYGPTETTIWSSARRIQEVVGQGGDVESIGSPISNTQIHILNSDLKEVPIGVSGEIYIGGAGVARGYLNLPGLTAERFVANPFVSDSGARLYWTGDVGQWRADGTIEYKGRIDHQVKIRGYRVELGEIEAQLVGHGLVKHAVVLAHEEHPGDKRLIAYVVGDRAAALASADQGSSDTLRREVVSEWRTVWKETYGAKDAPPGPSFAGLNSSYTGRPIPEGELREWLSTTVERIRALKPKRVLDIGCGVGLLLEQLAPQCATYVGTDLSAGALEQVRQWMGGREGFGHVQLLPRSAAEFDDLQPGSFDTVVLNSVAHYFPDIPYLLAVLQRAIRLLSPGGTIFMGDVRHLGLLSMFHSAVQLSKAVPTMSVGQLRQRIGRAVAQEKELVIDPQFFRELPEHLSGISSVDVQLRRGRSSNELTRYRYDVVLRTQGQDRGASDSGEVLPWRSIGSVAGCEAALRERRWNEVTFTAIPNARLSRESACKTLIETSGEHMNVSTLRSQLFERDEEGVDPETFWEMAEAYGYHTRVSWSADGTGGCFDVQLWDRTSMQRTVDAKGRPRRNTRPLAAYANDPLESSFRQQLVPQLREYLKDRLPDYMMPSAWMVLKELPLTPNGKLDRRALPLPQGRPEDIGEYVAPRTTLERAITDIWIELLRIEQVGIQDNFFELGGHSLLATRVVSRIREQLRLDLPVRALFDAPSVAQLAIHIEQERLQRATQEAQWTDDLSGHIQRDIDAMDDHQVVAEIAKLRQEIGQSTG
jgi:amino acid adenylation domain-containing protein